jgi:hypothetical protein
MRPCNAVLLGAGALVLSIALAASVAEAQEVVGIRLEAPAGHPGFGAFGVRLLKGGTIVGALDRTSIVSGGPASIRFTVSAADVPDAVELDFAVPFDGAQTLYSVAGLDFAFDRNYFLPNPSPGVGLDVRRAMPPRTHSSSSLSCTARSRRTRRARRAYSADPSGESSRPRFKISRAGSSRST